MRVLLLVEPSLQLASKDQVANAVGQVMAPELQPVEAKLPKGVVHDLHKSAKVPQGGSVFSRPEKCCGFGSKMRYPQDGLPW